MYCLLLLHRMDSFLWATYCASLSWCELDSCFFSALVNWSCHLAIQLIVSRRRKTTTILTDDNVLFAMWLFEWIRCWKSTANDIMVEFFWLCRVIRCLTGNTVQQPFFYPIYFIHAVLIHIIKDSIRFQKTFELDGRLFLDFVALCNESHISLVVCTYWLLFTLDRYQRLLVKSEI